MDENLSESESRGRSTETDSKPDSTNPLVVDCAIIGAGAAGLRCASRLLGETGNDTGLSVVVLEARDRIGGRILTTAEASAGGSFFRDHGAAWVHGAHPDNPMVRLLADAGAETDSETEPTPSEPKGEEGPGLLPVLQPVFDGNAWVRPHTVLHGGGGRTKPAISYFVDGTLVVPGGGDGNDGDGETDREHPTGAEPLVAEGSSRSLCPTSRSIRRHYRILRTMVSGCENGEFDETDCVDERYRQLSGSPGPGDEEDRLVGLLAPFYLYLVENWNGISMTETQLGEIVEMLVPGNDDGGSSTEETPEEKLDDPAQRQTPPCHHQGTVETDERYVCVGDFAGPHCKVETGMATVLDPLLRSLGDGVLRRNRKVVSVTDKEDRVRIETEGGETFEAGVCVSTLPLGCLQEHLRRPQGEPGFFRPPLSRAKEEAVSSLWSGSYKKVFLTFDRVFWPVDPPMIGLVRSTPPETGAKDPLPGRHLVLYNLWAGRGIPSVEAILCGDLGKWAFGRTDEAIRDAVLGFLAAAMGIPGADLSSSCMGCHVTRWEEDPFTRGSYSSVCLDTSDKHLSELSAPEWGGRLLFAGEATEPDHMGSVHAALMSGDRVAAEVLAAVRHRCSSNDRDVPTTRC
ncbi:unnamed protein product [Pseudo-nitzschia multistriata]|uniref:Amine oxidase domain-containing protein n=1 Tax=Pseudo-nitzschia multistriata TaxID=183589 RepID=A0A448ZML2_9STRA|nr:unnamed protein product [Pseudo-nitzschia multistriata]